jgi:hypothetical protein
LRPEQIGRIALATSGDKWPDISVPFPVIYAAIAEYTATGGQYRPPLKKVLRSLDGGVTWEDMNVPPGRIEYVGLHGTYNLAIATQRDNLGRVYVGLVNSIGTAYGLRAPATINWVPLDSTRRGKLQTHPDHHVFLVRSGDGVMYDGNDGGLWKAEFALIVRTLFADYTNLNNVNLNTILSFGADGFQWTDGNVYVEASQDNGAARWDSSSVPDFHWDTQIPGDGGTVLFGPNPPGYGYMWKGGGDPDAFRYTEEATGARNWAYVLGANTGRLGEPIVSGRADPYYGNSLNGAFLTPMAMSRDGTHLLIGTLRVWERVNPGTGWRQLGAPIGDQITALAYADTPGHYDTIYAGTWTGQLWKTENHGATWDNITANGYWRRGDKDKYVPIYAIACDYPSTNIVYVALADEAGPGRFYLRVWRSRNSGRFFSDVSGNLPQVPVFSMVIDVWARTSPHPVYVGIDGGVWVSNTMGGVWSRYFGTGAGSLPVVPVWELRASCFGELIAATVGRGVWVAPLGRPAGPIAIQGQATSGLVIGTFASTVGLGSPSVSIDWGDGSGIDTSTGALNTVGTTTTVTGSHTYAEAGLYTVTTTVNAGGAAVTITATAEV